MFTRNIRDIVVIGRKDQKWDTSESVENGPSSLWDKINNLPKDPANPFPFLIERKVLLNAATDKELLELKDISMKEKTGETPEYNSTLISEIQNVLDSRKAAKKVETEKQAAALPDAARGEAGRAKNRLQEETAEVTLVTKGAVDTEMKNIEKVIEHTDKEPLDIQFEANGKLKANSIIDLLSDLDGTSGVERTNRGWFRRTFFGGSDQKEVVGEQQLKQLLGGKNQAQLNELYARITGDNSGINITKENKKPLQLGENPQNNIYDFEHIIQSKISKFQIELIQQVDVMATIGSILLDDKDARTGLRSVLEGKTDDIQRALSDTRNVEKFKKTLAENGVLDRDPAFLEKVASVLLRMGISAGFSVFTGGVMGGYIEQAKLDIKNGAVNRDGINLKVAKGFGEDGSVSAVASLDLAGLRLEGNWNDPEMRISNRVAYVMDSDDKVKASSNLVSKINEQYGAGAQSDTKSEKEQLKSDKITVLGDSYLKSQFELNTLPDSVGKKDALAKNTLTYLTKVEALQGASLKGIFASATISGWIVGISGVVSNTSASSDKLKIGAGSIEAQVLGSEILTDNQINKYLEKLGITQDGDKYMQNEKVILTVPAGKKVIWNFEEIVTDRDTIVKAIPTIVDIKSASSSQIIHLKNKNVPAQNGYIDKNQKAVADLAKKLRSTDNRMTDLEKSISSGEYDLATTQLKDILKKSNNSTARGLLAELATLSTPESKKAFFDLLLGKTSGSDESRRLGAALEGGKDIKIDLTNYYNRLAGAFASQYGLQTSQVQAMFDAIKPTLDKEHISTLGTDFPNGFAGVVAYNQINAGKNFVTVDKIDHSNARIVGTPTLIADVGAADIIREKIKATISQTEAQAFQKNNPALNGANIEEVKSKMVAGPIHAYLSFENGAECFNLGFVGGGVMTTVDTPVAPISKKTIGSTVGRSDTNIASGGIGFGQIWKKEKEEPKKKEEEKKEEPKREEPKPEPKKEEPKPETKPEPKPQPKPEPEPKPHPKPHPKPEPKPEPKPKPPHPEPKPKPEPPCEPKPAGSVKTTTQSGPATDGLQDAGGTVTNQAVTVAPGTLTLGGTSGSTTQIAAEAAKPVAETVVIAPVRAR